MDASVKIRPDEPGGLMIPQPLPVRIRISFAHFILGNIGLAALLFALVIGLLPVWAVVAITCALAILLTLLAGHRTSRNNQRYLSQRTDEVTALTGNPAVGRTHALQDRSVALRVSTPSPIFALPSLILALAFVYFTFRSADAGLNTWYWFFRWPTALLAAGAHGVAMLMLWACVTYTPAYSRFNLVQMRKEHDDAREQQEVATKLGVDDHNDIQIIQLMAHLDSLHRRVETYTLESALLSALSFSSFLSIAVAEAGYLDDLKALFDARPEWRHLPFSIPLPGDLRIDSLPLWPRNFFFDHTIPLISLALLMCATTFLGVLVARLRFNDGYRDADSVLKAAERLNEKEDDALQRGDQARLANYSIAIAKMLDKADQLQRGLDLMLTYMRFSRNAGVVFFIGALILCGLLFSPIVAIAITVIMACAFLVGYIDSLVRGVLRRHVFSERGVGSLLRPFSLKKRSGGR